MNARKHVLEYINHGKFLKALSLLNELTTFDKSVDLFVGKIVLEGLIDPNIDIKVALRKGFMEHPDEFFEHLSRFLFTIYKDEQEEVGEILIRMLDVLSEEIPYLKNNIKYQKSQLLGKLKRFDEALEIINVLIDADPYRTDYYEYKQWIVEQIEHNQIDQQKIIEATA